jgi:hypothetical protein
MVRVFDISARKCISKLLKRIELNLGFEPIKNAPNLHIEWKGYW